MSGSGPKTLATLCDLWLAEAREFISDISGHRMMKKAHASRSGYVVGTTTHFTGSTTSSLDSRDHLRHCSASRPFMSRPHHVLIEGYFFLCSYHDCYTMKCGLT